MNEYQNMWDELKECWYIPNQNTISDFIDYLEQKHLFNPKEKHPTQSDLEELRIAKYNLDEAKRVQNIYIHEE